MRHFTNHMLYLEVTNSARQVPLGGPFGAETFRTGAYRT